MLRTARLAVLAAIAIGVPAVASAKIPAFARKYSVSCALCHAPIPHLNTFGEKFAANGFQMAPGEAPRDTIDTGDPLLTLPRSLPLAIRMDYFAAAYTKGRSGGPQADFQTPWVIKLLSGGLLAHNISYYTYFLLTERGEVAGLEDAYLQFTDVGGTGINVIAGQFTVSDPLFKREIRLSYEDYQAYRVRVGEATPDLTYDRGVMASLSPWEGADFSVQVVNGQGLNTASSSRQFDRNTPKNVAVRLSQEFGPLRIGGFAYTGSESSDGASNATRIYGPDASLDLGTKARVNAQFLRRLDDDPFFGSCSASSPCPGGATSSFGTTVDAAFGEVLFWPQGQSGRFVLTGSYNWVSSDRPVISLRLGEQDTPARYLRRYNAVSGGLHYVLRRNIRLTSELGWDFEQNRGRLIGGTVLAF
ncbi:MAG: hypothetical protein IT356_01890 [Gemmatimonadaceae bacterium]|nr:hypothetical protein [Gemmatimonadaceae bacterium]